MTGKPATRASQPSRAPVTDSRTPDTGTPRPDAPAARTLSEALRTQLNDHLATVPYSQAAIARTIGVTPKYLSQMLTGRAPLTLAWAEGIAIATGATIHITVTPRVEPEEETHA